VKVSPCTAQALRKALLLGSPGRRQRRHPPSRYAPAALWRCRRVGQQLAPSLALHPSRVLPTLSRRSTRWTSAPFTGRVILASPFDRNPYPIHYRSAFASSTLSHPQPHRLTLRLAVQVHEAVPGGLRAFPRFAQVPGSGRSRPYAGGTTSAV